MSDWSNRTGFERLRSVQELSAWEETRRFYRQINRKPKVTYVLLAIIVVFYLLVSIVPIDSFNALVLFGAKINIFIDNGQPWRFVSAMFLHAGFIHLFFNGYALWLLGRIIENLYGSRQFFILYFLSGVISIYASYLINPYGSSVGASGALFGLLGAGAVVGFKQKDEIPSAFRRFFGAGLVPWIILNLALGIFIPQIDNAAHVSGLIAGIGIALLMKADIKKKNAHSGLGDALLWNLSGIFALISVATIFTMIVATLISVATIFTMIMNYFDGGALTPPDEWQERSLGDVGVNVKQPSGWPAIPLENGDIGYFFKNEPTVFAVEREMQGMGTPNDLVDIIEREMFEAPGIERESVLLHEIVPFDWYGTTGYRTKIEYKVENSALRFEVPAVFVNGPKGFVSATCILPKDLYFAFSSWCDVYLDSLSPLEESTKQDRL